MAQPAKTFGRPRHWRRLRTQVLGERLEQRALLATYPTGFAETEIVSNLTSPVTFDIDPTGRIFLAFQNGTIRVIEDDQLLAQPLVILNTDGSAERGLQGIELDPQFTQNGYVYVYYTAAAPASHNRVSRLTVDLTTGNTLVPGSELVLLDLPDLSTVGNPIWHMGGAVHVSPDGTLRIQVGDHLDSSAPQDLDRPFGKVIRIHRDGTIPTDNPYYNPSDGIGWRDRIWSAGLRNPFSGDLDPETGRYFINDVGAGSWEEINDGTDAGRNFGWPNTEGPFNGSTFPGFTNPVHAYGHNVGCAITGGAFARSSSPQFPVEYQGKYFFADFCGGDIRVIDPANPADVQEFANDVQYPMNIEFAPDGSMYYVARGAGAGGDPGIGTGKVVKVQYVNQLPPFISLHPTDQITPVGETASLVARASGTAPLAYQWQRLPVGSSVWQDIGGATSDTLALPNVSLSQDNQQFRVIVVNAFGTAISNPARLDVTTDRRPIAEILTPVVNTTYTGGMLIQYSGRGTDPEDGVLAPASFTWQVDFHHDDHLHPFLPATTGSASGSFTIPTISETSANVWYRILLTVTDSAGLSQTIFRDVHPRMSQFMVTNNLAADLVYVDGQPKDAGETIRGVVGIQRVLRAPADLSANGLAYVFVGWDDGVQEAERTIATPPLDTSYTALYSRSAGGLTFLSDLVPASPPVNGWGPMERDLSNGESLGGDGNRITLNGVHYAKGIGVHAMSDVVYNLGGRYARFLADVGVDDEVGPEGSVVFTVIVDGQERYQSPRMTGLTATQSADIDVTGAQVLQLRVSDGGDNIDFDHADWANARLIGVGVTNAIRINFQASGVPTPTGYLPDTGQIFANRGNGYRYGWSSDHTDLARDRNIHPDQRLDTLLHFHQGQNWEIEVPNGAYAVNVSIGDPGFESTHTLAIEGIEYWNGITLGPDEYFQQARIAVVRDGRLTLDMGGAPEKATRINFVEIVPASLDPVPPRVLSVERNDGIGRYDRLDSLTFRFNEDVAPTVDGADLVLVHVPSGTIVPTSGIPMRALELVNGVRFDLASLNLGSGLYRATLRGNGISGHLGIGLDGDHDGQAGGDLETLHQVVLAGDINLDGLVDGADAATMFANWGATSAAWEGGDLNVDGVVDAADAGLLFGNWTGDPLTPVKVDALFAQVPRLRKSH